MSYLAPDFSIALGGVTFKDDEIPSTISFGGTQKGGVHQLPGGVRVIDTMSADDTDIPFEGMFFGADAFVRARKIDVFRKSGQQLAFKYYKLNYLVVVWEFKADFERYYQIPYRITLKIVSDLSAPAQLPAANSVFDLLNSDMAHVLEVGLALGMGIVSSLPSPVASSNGINIQPNVITAPPVGDALDLTTLAADLTVVRADVSAIVTIEGVQPASIAQLVAALQLASTECGSLMSESDVTLGGASTPGGIVAGAPDPDAFLAYVDINTQAALIVDQGAYLSRMQANAASGALS